MPSGIFTAEFDSWWPRGHHIGQSPMRRAVIEGRTGGRCDTEQEDGTEVEITFTEIAPGHTIPA